VLHAVAPHAPPVVHADEQQCPLPATSQMLLAHCAFAVHAPPAESGAPQVPATPGLKQICPTQSFELAHAVRQAVLPALHFKLAGHAPVVPATHVPVPLHALAVVSMLPVHDCTGPHGVDAAQRAQLPDLHWPVNPQLDIALATHTPRGSFMPSTTFRHVPSATPLSAALHALQTLVHAVLQHLPSTQKPLSHCAALVHELPMTPPSASGAPSGPPPRSSALRSSGAARSAIVMSEYPHDVGSPCRWQYPSARHW
jgi:hypothetical protein